MTFRQQLDHVRRPQRGQGPGERGRRHARPPVRPAADVNALFYVATALVVTLPTMILALRDAERL